MLLEALRAEVVETARQMYHSGLVNLTSGNISAIDADSGLVAITPSGVGYDTMTPEDVAVVRLDGTVIDGEHRPSSETPMHTMVYRERPDTGGVVHTHSTYATAFAAVKQEIPIVCTASMAIGGTIPVADFAPPGTEAVGRSALEALERGCGRVVLLQNHGLLAVSKTLKKAFANAVKAEEAAKVYHLALQIGEPIIMPDEVLREMLSRRKDKSRPVD